MQLQLVFSFFEMAMNVYFLNASSDSIFQGEAWKIVITMVKSGFLEIEFFKIV